MTKTAILKLSSLFLLFLLFLPFTRALTLNIGFPLKISELILGLLILASIANFRFRISKPKKIINIVLISFVIWASFSFVINEIWNYPYPLKQIPSRMGSLHLDSLLRLAYIYLSVIAYFISQKYFSKYPKALKFWLMGAVISSIYAWYLFLSSSLNIPYIKLFGMDEIPQNINGVVRCGTFKEGNFFGLYLLLSAVIALYLKRTKTGIFLILSIVTTLSTITFVSVFVFLVYLSRRILLKKKVLIYFLILLPFIAIFSIMFVQSSFFKEMIYAKLNKPSTELSPSNFSKVDRVLSSRIAFKQGLDNPFFGVGPYNYALHYDKFNDFETYIENNSEWSLNYFKRSNKRAIPNNVYLEVWSEYGVVGFAIFILFLILILIKAFQSKNDIITGGIIALMVSFNAFPSFIMLFIWAFLAIPLALTIKNRDKKDLYEEDENR